MTDSPVASELLSKINERRVLEFVQRNGPASRAVMARGSGMSAPTVSKAVSSLIRNGFLEETEALEVGFGRPGKLLQLSEHKANVLGVVIDADSCWIGCARLDGVVSKEQSISFRTPNSYDDLRQALINGVGEITGHVKGDLSGRFRGVCLSVPGLFNSRIGETVMSPNLHLLDGQRLASDLSNEIGLQCIALQESHALCIGERMYGAARAMNDFAMLDVSTGLGLGIVSGGHLLTGNSGMAGELGHITVVPDGQRCGCGNRGCLETVATDTAFARLISKQLGRKVGVQEALAVNRTEEVISQTVDYLAIAVAAVINIFNPATLFLHGQLMNSDPAIFKRVVREAKKRTLSPSFKDCRILQSKGNKRLGAVAGIIDHLANELAPAFTTIDNGNVELSRSTTLKNTL
jgi:predicted NBD/HSP70 family sugar kinase